MNRIAALDPKFLSVRFMVFVIVLIFAPVSGRADEKNAADPVHLSQERCSMRFVDAEVKDILRLLAKEYRLNMIISQNVEGRVTLDFNEVPLDDIFHSVLRTAGLGCSMRGDVILVATKKEILEDETERVRQLEQQSQAQKKIVESQEVAQDLISRTVKVRYILNTKSTGSIAKEVKTEKEQTKDLTQLANALKKMLSERKGASIEVVDAANALIITDIPERVAQIIAVVTDLDVPSPQIMVEARITEVSSDYTKELGIQWGGRYTRGDLVISGDRGRVQTQTQSQTADANNPSQNKDSTTTTSSEAGSYYVVDLPAEVGAGSGGTIGFLIGDLMDDFLDVQLSALEDQGKIRILAKPRVITQDNQKAYIKVGDEIPYQEKTGTGDDAEFSIEFKDAAIELEVTPHLVEGEVFMDVVVARKTPDWTRAIEGNPPLKAQALTTKVSVKSGDTFALGGLTLEEETNSTNGVPYLSKIPLLGYLFKKESKVTNKRDLIIFITPTVLGEAVRESTEEDADA